MTFKLMKATLCALPILALCIAAKPDTAPEQTKPEKHNHAEGEHCAIDADEVVITGSRTATLRRQSSTLVGVLSSKIFERAGAVAPVDVLDFQPGLRVEYNCSNCGVPQLRINGLEGQYSQILLDSRPIFSSLSAVYGLEQLPAAMIDRVEVVRGGGSALYGSNAIGGVVNIVTKQPSFNSVSIGNQTAVNQGGGADINTTLNGSFATKDNTAGVFLFGAVRDRSAYDRNDDGFSDIPQLKSSVVGFRSWFKLNESWRLTAEYHHMDEYRRGGDSLDRLPHQAFLAEQLRHRIDGGGLSTQFNSPDGRHSLSLYTSAQNIARESYFGTNQNLDAYGTTSDLTFVAGTQYTYAMGRCLWNAPARLTVGAEYTDNALRDEMLGYHRLLEQHSVSVGVFAQNEWRSDKLTLLLGARLDKHNKVNMPIVSPRVNVRYTPISELAFRASYSSGYRAPQAYDEDLHVAAVGGEVALISLDPNLRPEYAHSLSASIDFNKSWGRTQLTALVEGFYTDLRDVFVLSEMGHDAQGNLLLERRNAAGARVAGINAEFKLGLSPWLTIDGGWTWQQSHYKEAFKWSENPSIEPQTQMFRSPDWYGYLAVNTTPFKNFSAGLSGRYTGPMLLQHYGDPEGVERVDRQVVSRDFWDLTLRLAYDWRLSHSLVVQVSGGVKNILDHFQPDLDRGVLRDSKYVYGPAMPRQFFLGLKFTIG